MLCAVLKELPWMVFCKLRLVHQSNWSRSSRTMGGIFLRVADPTVIAVKRSTQLARRSRQSDDCRRGPGTMCVVGWGTLGAPSGMSAYRVLISTALTWGWPQVVGLLAFSWSAITRIGEVIGAIRSDLILPFVTWALPLHQYSWGYRSQRRGSVQLVSRSPKQTTLTWWPWSRRSSCGSNHISGFGPILVRPEVPF